MLRGILVTALAGIAMAQRDALASVIETDARGTLHLNSSGGFRFNGVDYAQRLDNQQAQIEALWAALKAPRPYRLIRESKIFAIGGEAHDQFGFAVAVWNNTLVVGTYTIYPQSVNDEAVYVFEQNAVGGQYEEVAKLVASDGAPNDRFGTSVAIFGTTILVGAHGDDDKGSASGSAYVFEKNAVTGGYEEVAKLVASDGAASRHFGSALAIHGTTLIVGCWRDNTNGLHSGSAYVFEKNGVSGRYEEVAKLVASDGADNDEFGRFLAMSANIVIVSARNDDDKGVNSGSAYVFEKNAVSGQYEEVAKLIASDGADDDGFGRSVAISGTTLLIGAQKKSNLSGSAYVFEKNAVSGQYEEVAKLVASDGAADDMFGVDVAISGTTLLIGARHDDDKGDSSGSAYVFEKNALSGEYEEVAKLIASDGAPNDIFGTSVAIFDHTLLVGAFGDDLNGMNSGSAYVFKL